MDRERIDELWLKRGAGETLSAEEERELLEALKQDPQLLSSLRADERMEGLLRLAGRKDTDEERFLRRFESRVAAEDDAGRFVEKVESRVGHRTRRASAKATPSRLPLIAAVALLALAAIVMLQSPDPQQEPTVKASPRTAPEPPAVRPPAPARQDPVPPKAPGDDLRARAEEELGKAAEEFRRRQESQPKPAPEERKPVEPRPEAEKTPEPPPDVKEPEKREATRAVAATVIETRGKVILVGPQGKTPAAAGAGLAPGSGIEILDAESSAIVAFPDGTRVEIQSNTVLRDVQDGERGKRLTLEKGEIRATVARQPKDSPMVFATPQAEATVLGTTLRLFADPDAKRGTRLEVEEGKVRLKNLSSGKTVDLTSGHVAVAAVGLTLSARPARLRNGLVSLYQFAEGEGRWIRDVAGTSHRTDLRIGGEEGVDFRWGKSRGLTLLAGNLAKGNMKEILAVRADPADKIIEACRKTQEFTVELWVIPAGFEFVRQDTQSVYLFAFENPPSGAVNFSLMQVGTPQSARRYATRTNLQGTDFSRSFGTVELRLTHLAYTRKGVGAATVYLNGVPASTEKPPVGPAAWEPNQSLALGNSVGGNNPWRGEFHLVAIYDRALAPEEVLRNHRAGLE